MKLKKIHKYANKTHKMKKNKKGGFSWPDISSWKSNITEKIRNFSIFKKKNVPLSNKISSAYNEMPKPIEPKPIEPKPIEPKPIEPQSVEPQSVEQLPVEQLPVEQLPVEQLPVEQSRVQQLPVESTSIEPIYQNNTQKNSENNNNLNNYSGGYRASHSLTNLASTGAPFWQPTAKPQVWVGGKRKNKKTHKKSKKSKKTHKKHY